MSETKKKPLKITSRNDDDYKIATFRIKSKTLEKLDEIAGKTKRSRNEVANVMLDYGVENIEVE